MRDDEDPDERATQVDRPTVAPTRAKREDAEFESRYERKQRLGAGGMGEVWLCRDHRIARDVAMKVMKTELDDRAAERFVAESRTQGGLEHPSIVPVYDIGITPNGEPYFTMKRVQGITLRAVLNGLRAHDAAIEAGFTRHRLLAAFSQLCLTIDYAHQRDVLHRDLKPENIMLGEFGEVFVLDWGIARSIAEASRRPTSEAGTMLGTPEYMAPEQRSGHADPRSDIFALGRMLFEIVTLKSLHESDLDAEPMPEELAQACRTATSFDPDARLATARELATFVDRYLAGDRDLALRRRLAHDHAERADAAARRALAGASADRKRALADVGRALAFDPSHREALETLVRLLDEPPAELPPEAVAEWDASREVALAMAARAGGFILCVILACAPILLWMGIREYWLFGLNVLVAITATSYVFAIGPVVRATRFSMLLGTALVCLLVAFLTPLFGPLFLAPGIACFAMGAFSLHVPRSNVLAISFGVLALGVPLVLEWSGLIPPSYRFEGGALCVIPRMVHLPATATTALLVISSIAIVPASAIFFGNVRRERAETDRRLYLQKWQLRQLVPDLDGQPRR